MSEKKRLVAEEKKKGKCEKKRARKGRSKQLNAKERNIERTNERRKKETRVHVAQSPIVSVFHAKLLVVVLVLHLSATWP